MRRLAVGLGLLVATLFGLAAPGFAQSPNDITVGTRLTFYSSSASIPGSRSVLVWKPGCNPETESCWVDQRNGDRFGQEESRGSGGAGVTEVDVVYYDGRTCVMRASFYLLDPTNGTVSFSTSGGFATTDGNCSDYWMAADNLAGLREVNEGGMTIIRGPYELGRDRFDAVSIGSFSAGASTHYGYEEQSGILRVASTRGQTGPVWTPGTGPDATRGAGSTLLTYTQLLDVTTPYGNAPSGALPRDVQGLRRLVYQCQTSVGIPGSQAMAIPCEFVVDVQDRDRNFLLYSTRQTSPGATGVPSVVEGSGVIVNGGPGGLYADPDLLSGLSVGDVLDEDRITGKTMYVGEVTGDSVTVIVEGGPDRIVATYDLQSGLMIGSELSMQNGIGSQVFATRLAQVQ